MDIPSGYSKAGQITTHFDGGNHPIKGDVWSCGSCGCLILPVAQNAHDRFHAQIGALLDEANQVASS
jgi:hypothetical protein